MVHSDAPNVRRVHSVSRVVTLAQISVVGLEFAWVHSDTPMCVELGSFVFAWVHSFALGCVCVHSGSLLFTWALKESSCSCANVFGFRVSSSQRCA